MSAVLEEIDPADVQLPGPFGTPSVAAASDEQLTEARASDYRHIAAVLEQDNVKPGDDGLAPAHWLEHCRENRSKHNNLSSVERAQRRIRAINVELERREAERQAARESAQESARANLQRLVDTAPARARELVDAASEGQAAADRIRQLLTDIETAGALAGVAEVYGQVAEGANEAAKALGTKAPKLPEMDARPLSRDELGQVQALFTGRRAAKGWTAVHRPGDFVKVREIASKM